MEPLEKELLVLKDNHQQLSFDFDYHKKEFEEVKKELKVLGNSLSEISHSIKMIKYVGIGAFAMYILQSTGSWSHFIRILTTL